MVRKLIPSKNKTLLMGQEPIEFSCTVPAVVILTSVVVIAKVDPF